jgi:arginine decarboxylase
MGDTTMATVPTKMFLTKGVGKHKEQLNSFELALRDASIAEFNLVSVSSILPPRAKIISKQAGLGYLQPGQIVHTVISKNSTCEPNRLVSASIGVATPKDPTRFGYLSEHHAFGQTRKVAGDYAEDLAAEMLATTLGLPFNVDKSWDERREEWKIKGIIVRTRNVTQSAQGDPKGLWTTVVAAAILITE